MTEPYRVMTVCTGNICRSPMGQVVLQDRFTAAGLGGSVVVTSSGTSAEERGNPIDPRAIDVLRASGYPVPRHRARQITEEDIRSHDLLLAMTAGHMRALQIRSGDAACAHRVRMFRSFDPAAADANGRPPEGADPRLDVEDPWYGVRQDFVVVLQQLEAAAGGVVDHVRRQLEARRSAG